MKNEHFSKIYTKVQQSQKNDEEDLMRQRKRLRSCLDTKIVNSYQKKSIEKQIINKERFEYENFSFDIFVLKMKDLKTLDHAKYIYFVSMIITCSEKDDEITKKYEISDVMSNITDDLNVANAHYSKLRKILLSKDLETIFKEIDNYLNKYLK